MKRLPWFFLRLFSGRSKRIFWSIASSVALLLFFPLALFADQSDYWAYATSPDHPSTWVVGAHNIRQVLRWDAKKQMLFADVKYSTEDYADSSNPPQEDDFSLRFPTVHFDPVKDEFTAKGIKVGALHHGFLGPEIVLGKGFDLSIHRHHGRVFAMIVPSEDS